MQWFFFKLIIRRSINTLGFIVYFLLDSHILLKSYKNRQKTGIIKLGAIGDYVLFRNLLPELSKAKGKLTLIITKEVAPICEYFDGEYVDEIVVVDPAKMETNLFYRFGILSQIRRLGFSTLIQTSFSRRALVEDAIIRFCNSSQKITPKDEGNHIAYHLNLFTDQLYDQVIHVNTTSSFEYLKNHAFIEQIIGSFELPKYVLHLSKKDKKTITLFPGAGRPYRKWSPEKFAQVANWLIQNTSYELIILGPQSDFKAGEIIKGDNERIINMCGKVTLIESTKFVADSSLLLGNESHPAHIGAALDIPTLAISNGNHFGRFHPYPKEISDTIHFLYPPEFKNELANKETDWLVRKYRLRSLLDINEVTVDQVITQLKVII